MTNTERPITKAEQKKEAVVETEKKVEAIAPEIDKVVNKKTNDKVEQSDSKNKELTGKEKSATKGAAKEEKKKPIVKKPVKKKTEAAVNIKSVPISTKHSIAICKFIRNKKIDDAVAYLEKVVLQKKAIPMKGEIPHRKGKMMSGRFPKKASEHFIKILKSLKANARANDLDDAVIVEAIANFASRPSGKFGRVQKKRTHIKIKCKEKKWKKEK